MILQYFYYYIGFRHKPQEGKARKHGIRLNSGIQKMHILIMELLECAVIQRFTNPLHQMIVEIQVVHNSQTHTQHFICLLQVADVSAAVIAADRAIALRVNGLFVTLIFQVFNVDDAVPCEQVAMAGVAAGHNAVKQIHTAVHTLNDVAGGANAIR